MKLPRRWLRLPGRERVLALKALALLAAIRVGLQLLPLRRLLLVLDWTAGKRRFPFSPNEQELAREIHMVEAVGRRLLGDRPCLAQALAGRWLYRRRNLPAELCIGVIKEGDGELGAHAWLESEGRVVTGGPEELLARYTRLQDLEKSAT